MYFDTWASLLEPTLNCDKVLCISHTSIAMLATSVATAPQRQNRMSSAAVAEGCHALLLLLGQLDSCQGQQQTSKVALLIASMSLSQTGKNKCVQ